MEKNSVIHRDLKPENLLLDKFRNIKIIDFGFGNTFHRDRTLDTYCGSPFYAAPEMIKGVRYVGPEVDIWSLGVILFALLSGRLPFDAQTMPGLYEKISKGEYTIPHQISNDAAHLISRMLTVNPKKRATLDEVIHHRWTNYDSEGLINNYLKERPAVVPKPNVDSVRKLVEFGLGEEEIYNLLAIDIGLHPITSLYHMIEDCRIRDSYLSEKQESETTLVNSLSSSLPALARGASKASSFDQDDYGDLNKIKGGSGPVISQSDHQTISERYSSAPNARTDETLEYAESSDDEIKFKSTCINNNNDSSNQINNHSNNDSGIPIPKIATPKTGPARAIYKLTRPRISVQSKTPVGNIIDQFSALTTRSSSQKQTKMPSPAASCTLSRENSLHQEKMDPFHAALYMNGQTAAKEYQRKSIRSASPRVVKGFFNVSTTSSKSEGQLKMEIERVLKLNRIKYELSSHLVYLCEEGKNSQFEIEICRVPHIGIYGLHMKRIRGSG